MKYSIIYICTVVLINIAFTYIHPVELFDGTIWSVGSVVAGVVFVARDYAQREVGHKKVILLMAAAGAISYLMADPFVAIASLAAFSIAEASDYLVYTYYKGTFKQKIIASSLVGVPIDTVVFLSIISYLSWFSFVVMCISKLIVLVFIARRGGDNTKNKFPCFCTWCGYNTLSLNKENKSAVFCPSCNKNPRKVNEGNAK